MSTLVNKLVNKLTYMYFYIHIIDMFFSFYNLQMLNSIVTLLVFWKMHLNNNMNTIRYTNTYDITHIISKDCSLLFEGQSSTVMVPVNRKRIFHVLKTCFTPNYVFFTCLKREKIRILFTGVLPLGFSIWENI